MSRYEYNKLNLQPGKILKEDNNSIIYEPNKDFDIDDMKRVSVELSFTEVNKKMINSVLAKVVHKMGEIGLENLIPIYMRPLVIEYSNIDENFLLNYLKKDVEKSLSSNKRALKQMHISKKDRKGFCVQYNVENIFKRLVEDMMNQRIIF